MTRLGLGAAAQRVLAVASLCPQIKVGVEAAGHYHRPVVDYRWPPGWEVPGWGVVRVSNYAAALGDPNRWPAAKTYAHGLKGRGKRGGVIACALAHRANRIAHALVRDHAVYDPARWS